MRPSASRRALLHGRMSVAKFPRPPGALAPMRFEDLCTQCGDCARACPEGILLRDGEGFPVLDPREGKCSFCMACTNACTLGALLADTPFPWRAAVSQACLSLAGTGCRICEDQCDTAAIRFRPLTGGRAAPVFDLARCTGCGACVAPCPVGAVSLSPHTPTMEPASC